MRVLFRLRERERVQETRQKRERKEGRRTRCSGEYYLVGWWGKVKGSESKRKRETIHGGGGCGDIILVSITL